LPLHLQVCFRDLGHKEGDFPVSERLANESLALPVHGELAGHEVEHICRTLKNFYE
jgi:UDP-2-acetamido-2-deoxy-ribo-hexuluronate aminotransferase